MSRLFESLASYLKTNATIDNYNEVIARGNIIVPEWKVVSRISEKEFDGFQEDLMGPLVVTTSSAEGVYILIDGYRRLKASTKEEFNCCVLKFSDANESKRLAPILSLLLNNKTAYTNKEIESIISDKAFTGTRVADNVFDSAFGFDSGSISSVREVLSTDDDSPQALAKLKVGFQKDKITPSQLIGKLKAAKKKLEKQEEDYEADGSLGSKDLTNSLRADKLQQSPDNRVRIDPALKKAVLIRDKNTCQCCGLTGAQWASSLVYHHKVPVALGGPDTMENGITLCVNCHLAVHTYQVGELFIPEDLTPEEKEVVDKICALGNIAIDAARKKDLSPKEVKSLTSGDFRHPYPTENLKVNREAEVLSESLGDTDTMSDEELLEAVKQQQ